MNGFIIKFENNIIRFEYYLTEAPETCAAFHAALPFSRKFFHARVSGQEFWTDQGLLLQMPQENASVFTQPGEAVIGPVLPSRVKTANAIGIYYGEGKGLDAANIFATVVPEDLPALKALGESIWKEGQKILYFEALQK